MIALKTSGQKAVEPCDNGSGEMSIIPSHEIRKFKYWLRVHKIPLSRFGTGTKNNPIKIRSKKILSTT